LATSISGKSNSISQRGWFPGLELVECGPANSKLVRKFVDVGSGVGGAAWEDDAEGLGRRFVVPGLITPPVISALLGHVPEVFAFGAEPKMIWVDAGWVVAGMADANTRRNGATEKHIGSPVCPESSLARLSLGDHPIAKTAPSTGPFPAGVGFLNPFKKPFEQRSLPHKGILSRCLGHVNGGVA